MIINSRKSFTLIELLVVLALVAILSVVVILTLNPAELIKQARDSNRLSDLSTINTALNLFSTDVASGFMGTSSVVYVSIPSASPTCSGLGLPTLSSGYTYNCVTTANLRNTDGTGWIPVNFQRISSNSPVSQLPVDPINTTSTRLYYTYVSGGSWELNASVEATKNKLGGSGDLVSKDGGSATSLYEVGNNLNLNPIETGDPSLVGYWNFENDVQDHSGNFNNGTWYGTSVSRYVTGKAGQFAGTFNGIDDLVFVPATSSINVYTNFTVAGWVNLNSYPSGSGTFISKRGGGDEQWAIRIYSLNTMTDEYYNGGWLGYNFPNGNHTLGAFHHIAIVNNGLSNIAYVNGVELTSATISLPFLSYPSSPVCIGTDCSGGRFFDGKIDDVRIYSRALSAAEVFALYDATK